MKEEIKSPPVEIDHYMPDFSQDPFFLKKEAQAREIVESMTPADWKLIEEIVEKYK